MRCPARNIIGHAFCFAVFLTFSGCGGTSVFEFTPDEFANLNGAEAKEHLKQSWPEGVNPDEVEAVSFKSESSRDSYSTWDRITLTETTASKWADKVHDDEIAWCKSRADGHTVPEGVKRMIAGPPSLHRQTGSTPTWWTPPKIDFRATEVMLWYQEGKSGVARATYTGFDEAEKTLWIYQYAAQHELLWKRGKPPEGDPLNLAAKK